MSTMATSNGYSHGATYQARMPSPPRLVVPALSTEELNRRIHYIPYYRPSRTSQSPNPSSRPAESESQYQIPTATLRTNGTTEWDYTLRRVAQPILENLWLGPTAMAKDVEFLRKEGITLVLGIRHILPTQRRNSDGNEARAKAALSRFEVAPPPKAASAAQELGIQCKQLGLINQSELIPAFKVINELIHQHLNHASDDADNDAGQPTPTVEEAQGASSANLRKVLLHCETGTERSAAACAAYLMYALEGVDWSRAVQFVQAQRFCSTFDGPKGDIKQILKTYGNDLIKAGRDAQRGQDEDAAALARIRLQLGDGAGGRGSHRGGGAGGSSLVLAGGTKRARDDRDDDDDDVDMIGAGQGDHERFEDRAFAPFVDDSPGAMVE